MEQFEESFFCIRATVHAQAEFMLIRASSATIRPPVCDLPRPCPHVKARRIRRAIAGLALAVTVGGCSAHGASRRSGAAAADGAVGGAGGVGAGAESSGNAGVSGAAASGGNSGVDGGAGGASGAGGAPAVGNGYYVSPEGSDSAQGTMSAPFQTVEKARDVVRTVNGNMTDDIHVYLRGGTYRITKTIAFGPQDSGTNGHRIFYEAYPNETPVFNGATKVTGWTLSSGNVYQAQLSRSTKLRNLYVNDARALLTSKKVTATAGYGTYAVTMGQASWAWASGSQSDGAKYSLNDVPSIA
ncbi:MAG TPA: hypothetical protein VF331_11665, partial [Polyangiales bacterium]